MEVAIASGGTPPEQPPACPHFPREPVQRVRSAPPGHGVGRLHPGPHGQAWLITGPQQHHHEVTRLFVVDTANVSTEERRRRSNAATLRNDAKKAVRRLDRMATATPPADRTSPRFGRRQHPPAVAATIPAVRCPTAAPPAPRIFMAIAQIVPSPVPVRGACPSRRDRVDLDLAAVLISVVQDGPAQATVSTAGRRALPTHDLSRRWGARIAQNRLAHPASGQRCGSAPKLLGQAQRGQHPFARTSAAAPRSPASRRRPRSTRHSTGRQPLGGPDQPCREGARSDRDQQPLGHRPGGLNRLAAP